MNEETPIKAYVGTYPIARDVTISAVDLQRASDEIDAERTRRRLAAAEEKARLADAARKPPRWWARLLAAIFFRRRL